MLPSYLQWPCHIYLALGGKIIKNTSHRKWYNLELMMKRGGSLHSEAEAVEVLERRVASSCDMRGLISYFSAFLLGVGVGGWGKVRMERGSSLGWGAYTTWVRTPKRRPTFSKAVRALSR